MRHERNIWLEIIPQRRGSKVIGFTIGRTRKSKPEDGGWVRVTLNVPIEAIEIAASAYVQPDDVEVYASTSEEYT